MKLIYTYFYLPPAAEGRGWEIIKYLPYMPGNLFQVLNLTFDGDSRLNEVVALKHPYFSLIIGAVPTNVLPEKKFGCHSQLFKNN